MRISKVTLTLVALTCVNAGKICGDVDNDGDIDLFDLFAVWNAFPGIDPCCGGLP